jgi:predicted MPP superfamily phosphohydrolase
MTISTTLWFFYRSAVYCGVTGILLTWVPLFRLRKPVLITYWILNVLIMGTWFASEFSDHNWLVTTPVILRWILAIWQNANMAFVPLAFLIWLYVFWRRRRNKPLQRIFWQKPSVFLLPAMFVLAAFGVQEALAPPVLRHYDVYLKTLPAGLDGMKIAQITDSHVGDFIGSDDLKDAILRLNQEKPDLLVMTGDLLDDERQLKSSFDALSLSTAPLGVVGILGNHEKYHGLDEILAEYHSKANAVTIPPIRLLVDSHLTANYHGTDFAIAGVDYPSPPNSRKPLKDIRFDDFMRRSAAHAFHGISPDEWTLCLSHHPNFLFLSADYKVSLTLSGHTHGGQVLPLGYTVGRYAYDFKYLKGWFTERGSQLFVSVGMGQLWPFRLGVPKEIVTMTLHRQP